MKFSEAIRTGATWDDLRGWFQAGDASGPCCAIGGALRSIGVHLTREVGGADHGYLSAVESQFPIARMYVDCPATKNRIALSASVSHVFEILHWSKKAIAEWVETIEKKLEAEQLANAPSATAQTEAPSSALSEVALID